MDSPLPPRRGLQGVCPPSFAGGLPGFWVPLVWGLARGCCFPLILKPGGIPPRPPGRGLCPLPGGLGGIPPGFKTRGKQQPLANPHTSGTQNPGKPPANGGGQTPCNPLRGGNGESKGAKTPMARGLGNVPKNLKKRREENCWKKKQANS